MKIVRSKVLGFCSGVSRAVKIAERALEKNPESPHSKKKIFSLGPLIHNERALQKLRSQGLSVIFEKDIPSLNENCEVIIRAHGAGENEISEIKKTGAAVLDATCPRVALSQKRAADFCEKGGVAILAGDEGHAEVSAVRAAVQNAAKNFFSKNKSECENERERECECKNECERECENFFLVQNEEDAKNLFFEREKFFNGKKILLLSQTTFSSEEFSKIADFFLQKIPSLKIFNSICPAMQRRKDALASLSKKTDAIAVIGGKNSANTKRLFLLARSLCKNAFFLQDASDIQKKNFSGVKSVGIAAGASTPDFLIEEICEALALV